jgi:hypothetical protein
LTARRGVGSGGGRDAHALPQLALAEREERLEVFPEGGEVRVAVHGQALVVREAGVERGRDVPGSALDPEGVEDESSAEGCLGQESLAEGLDDVLLGWIGHGEGAVGDG